MHYSRAEVNSIAYGWYSMISADRQICNMRQHWDEVMRILALDQKLIGQTASVSCAVGINDLTSNTWWVCDTWHNSVCYMSHSHQCMCVPVGLNIQVTRGILGQYVNITGNKWTQLCEPRLPWCYSSEDLEFNWIIIFIITITITI